MTDIGKYKHRISFVSYESAPDGYGGTVDTPVTVLSTWAEKDPLRASRNLSEAQINMKKTTVFNIRYRAGFEPDTKMKVLYKGRLYQIQGAVEDKDIKGRFWQITATDQQAAEDFTT